MSLAGPSLGAREPGHSNANSVATTRPIAYTEDRSGSSAAVDDGELYADSIYDEFYDMDDHDHDLAATGPAKECGDAAGEAPALPQKSTLRASCVLDGVTMKCSSTVEVVESTEQGRVTPHEMYFSSEEDASASADDFSNYEHDFGDENDSPTRRSSHQDMAKVVNVVYAGKPSIVQLSPTRLRSVSPISSVLSRSDSTMSSSPKSAVQQSSSPPSPISSSLNQPRRKSIFLTGNKKHLFLNIDPFANGSSYTLGAPTPHEDKESSPPKAPRTPTEMLRGMGRTFSLVRKKSRCNLNGAAAHTPRLEHILKGPPSLTTPLTHVGDLESPKFDGSKRTLTWSIDRSRADSPVVSPRKVGILGGLSARRRSIKFTGRSM